MPVFTTIFEDTFDRANENPLNPTNWISNLGVGSNDLHDSRSLMYFFGPESHKS
jgi:hypothetical protein